MKLHVLIYTRGFFFNHNDCVISIATFPATDWVCGDQKPCSTAYTTQKQDVEILCYTDHNVDSSYSVL